MRWPLDHLFHSITYYESPLGIITLQANEQGLLGAWFEIHTTKPDQLGIQDDSNQFEDKIITKFYPIFGLLMIVMTVAIAVSLLTQSDNHVRLSHQFHCCFRTLVA